MTNSCCFFDTLKSAQQGTISSCIDRISSYYIKLRKRTLELSDAKAESKIADARDIEMAENDIDILKMIAERYTSVASFVSDLSLEAVNNKHKDGCFVLTTIHSAKGLEFNNVFILDCYEGGIPSAGGSKECLSEELRCFYVAITRAKERLFLLYPHEDQRESLNMSSFLDYKNVLDSVEKIDARTSKCLRYRWY